MKGKSAIVQGRNFIMLTQRLGSETQKDPAFLAELIAAIQAHPGSCDEVWLATDYGFPSMETHRASAEVTTHEH